MCVHVLSHSLGLFLSHKWLRIIVILSILFYWRIVYCNELKVLAPLSIGFAVFMVHLTTIPITGIGINPARSFDAAVIYNKAEAWDDHVSTLSLLRLLIICIITKVVCLLYHLIICIVYIQQWWSSWEVLKFWSWLWILCYMYHISVNIHTKKKWCILNTCYFLCQWIFWVGPFIGATIAALYHQFVMSAGAA